MFYTYKIQAKKRRSPMSKDKKELTDFLLWEYGQNRIIPPTVRINGKEYMVPHAYVRE